MCTDKPISAHEETGVGHTYFFLTHLLLLMFWTDIIFFANYSLVKINLTSNHKNDNHQYTNKDNPQLYWKKKL